MQKCYKDVVQTPISASSVTKIPNFLLHYLAFTYIGRQGHHHKRVPPSMGHKNYVSMHVLYLTYKVSAFASQPM
jgi:hypothetical protein